MTGGSVDVAYDELHEVASELERCATEVALLTPRLVYELALSGAELLPLSGVLDAATLVYDIGRC